MLSVICDNNMPDGLFEPHVLEAEGEGLKGYFSASIAGPQLGKSAAHTARQVSPKPIEDFFIKCVLVISTNFLPVSPTYHKLKGTCESIWS